MIKNKKLIAALVLMMFLFTSIVPSAALADTTTPSAITVQGSSDSSAALFSGTGSSTSSSAVTTENNNANSSSSNSSGTKLLSLRSAVATPSAYDVTIANGITGGTVTASPNNNVAEGTTVTVTATPDSGYELKTITASTNSSSLNVTINGNSGTFTMPEANVTVNAEFEEEVVTITAPTIETYQKNANGTYTKITSSGGAQNYLPASLKIPNAVEDVNYKVYITNEKPEFALTTAWVVENGVGYIEDESGYMDISQYKDGYAETTLYIYVVGVKGAAMSELSSGQLKIWKLALNAGVSFTPSLCLVGETAKVTFTSNGNAVNAYCNPTYYYSVDDGEKIDITEQIEASQDEKWGSKIYSIEVTSETECSRKYTFYSVASNDPEGIYTNTASATLRFVQADNAISLSYGEEQNKIFNSIEMASIGTFITENGVTKATMTLNADISEENAAGLTIPAGVDFTLELNGHTISADTVNRLITVEAGAKLTIQDSSEEKTGTLVARDNVVNATKTATADNPTVINITGGTFKNVSTNSLIAAIGKYNNVNITGGTFVGETTKSVLEAKNGQFLVENCTINIGGDGGSAKGVFEVSSFASGDKLTVRNVTVDAKEVIFRGGSGNSGYDVIVESGIFRTTHDNIAINKGAITEIKGGIFQSAATDPYVGFNGVYDTIAVPDGKILLYVEDEEAFMLTDIPETQDSGSLTVIDGEDATSYTKVQEAFAAVTDGGTIRLDSDSKLEKCVTGLAINTNVTIDLNGYTLNVIPLTSSADAGVVTVTNGKLTIVDNSAEGKGKLDLAGNYGIVLGANGNFEMQSGTVYSNAVGIYSYAGDSSMVETGRNVSISGGKVEAALTAIQLYDYFGNFFAMYPQFKEMYQGMGLSVKTSFSMTGGEVHAETGYGIEVSGMDGAVISGGTITTNNADPLYVSNGSVIVTGNTQLVNMAEKGEGALFVNSMGDVTVSGNAKLQAHNTESGAIRAFSSGKVTVEGDAVIEGGAYAIWNYITYGVIPTVVLNGGHYKFTTLPIYDSKNVVYKTVGDETYILNPVENTKGDYAGYYDLATRSSLAYIDDDDIERTYQELDDLVNTLKLARNKLKETENYTEETLTALQTAVTGAEALVTMKIDDSYETANVNANQFEVDYWTNQLNTALNNLKGVSDLDPENLANGTYSVSIAMHVYTQLQNSMTAGAIDPQAVLKVKDGEYTMQVKFKPLYVLSSWGHLLEMWVWNGENRAESTSNVSSWTGEASTILNYSQNAEILDYYTKESNPVNMTVCSEDHTHGGDTCYPYTVAIPLNFVDKSSSTYALRVGVDMMRYMGIGDQNVDMYVQWDTLQALEMEPTLKLNTESVSLIAGMTGYNTATVTAALQNADGYTVTWSSSDESVAIVNDGVITAIAGGTAIITCTAANGTTALTKTVTVAVTGNTGNIEPIAVTVESGVATMSGDTLVTSEGAVVYNGGDDVTVKVPSASSVVIPVDTAVALEGKTIIIKTAGGDLELSGSALAAADEVVTLQIASVANPNEETYSAAYEISVVGTAKVTVTLSEGADSIKYAYPLADDKRGDKQNVTVDGNTVSWSAASGTWVLSTRELSTGGSSKPNQTEKTFLEKDGQYYVGIALYKAASDELSMGNVAFENNSKALVTVEDGEITWVQVATNPVVVSGYKSAIISFAVDGSDVDVLETGNITTSYNDEPIDDYEYIKLVKFLLPDYAQPVEADEITYVDVEFYVPDTPMDEVVNAKDGLFARIRFDWGTAKSTDNDDLSVNSSTAKGKTEITSEEVDITDKATGIRLNAGEDVLPEDTTMKVEAITEGTNYDTAAAALEGISDTFKLYNIVVKADGEDAEPSRTVAIYFPIPSDYDAAKVAVYRINEDGTKVVVKGELKNGNYVIETKTFGMYALVLTDEVLNQEKYAKAIQKVVDQYPDLQGHWAASTMAAMVNRGLLSGVSDNQMAPDTALTRGMMVTILHRMAGSPAPGNGGYFRDVPDFSWYVEPIRWASNNGVVSGVGEKLFAPDQAITREQLAVMLVNYAAVMDIELPRALGLGFSDADAVSDWADEAVRIMVSAKIIGGYEDGTLRPDATATRAEAAAMIERFLTLYVDPMTEAEETEETEV